MIGLLDPLVMGIQNRVFAKSAPALAEWDVGVKAHPGIGLKGLLQKGRVFIGIAAVTPDGLPMGDGIGRVGNMVVF
jgi:hypothetical protein